MPASGTRQHRVSKVTRSQGHKVKTRTKTDREFLPLLNEQVFVMALSFRSGPQIWDKGFSGSGVLADGSQVDARYTTTTTRLRAHLILVLDVSSSMAGAPLAAVVREVGRILQCLDGDDFLTMHTFASTTEFLGHGKVRNAKTNVLAHKLKQRNSGCTALYDAVKAGVASVTSNAHGEPRPPQSAGQCSAEGAISMGTCSCCILPPKLEYQTEHLKPESKERLQVTVTVSVISTHSAVMQAVARRASWQCSQMAWTTSLGHLLALQEWLLSSALCPTSSPS